MSSSPTTPRARTTFEPTTPATARITGHAVQASPHYATTRRHSLYGVEDRVIIDPGSRIWKVGFSGEGKPRDVFLADGKLGLCLWNLRRATNAAERAEEERLLELRLQTCLRSVFHESLLTDPKARKVIVVEHPLLPLYIKEIIARILFKNNVPSISFASSCLLSLFAVGRITGLVLDCGHLETAVLPIFASRPLFPDMKTTPLAGARLTEHIRALLLMFGTYLPPPTTLSGAVNVPAANRATRVPLEVLTDLVVEEIKTRCCFVGDLLGADGRPESSVAGDESESEWDGPPSSDPAISESEFSQHSHTGRESISSSHHDSSEYSVVSSARHASTDTRVGEGHLQSIATMYTRHSTATDLRMPVTPPSSQQTGTGKGTLIVPGWIRERAAEMLFEGDVDEASPAETVLDTLLRIPLDLRKTMASSILVSGGTAMLPGFIPRLHAELARALSTPPGSSRVASKPGKPLIPQYDCYAALRPLLPYLAIMNNPSPPQPASDRAKASAGRAPAFTPATLAWVGGSLAGALKTGGAEVVRERWDEAQAQLEAADESMEGMVEIEERRVHNILPDWTRIPLPQTTFHSSLVTRTPAAGAATVVAT